MSTGVVGRVQAWGGRRAQAARAYVAGRDLPCACARCGRAVTDQDRWVVGHVQARATHPELTWVPSNWQVECGPCSDASAQSVVQVNAARAALTAAGVNPDTLFSHGASGLTPPPLPRSLSSNRGTMEVPERLLWDAERLAEAPWLSGLLSPPGDAAVPLAMTPPHPEATGSYGPDAVAWIERSLGITLRWWQQLAIVRQLEHREDGSLVWRFVVESCPRRAGKSVRIRGMALWRMAHAELIGEVQTVLHTGNELPICREIQRGAWRWASDQDWTVAKSNGKEAIEAPDGSRWLVRSQDGVYGWEAGLAVVDEGWDVKPDTISEGLEPAMLERLWSQLHLTSTAHRRATSLMRERISGALTDDDGETLLLLWAAPSGADVGDPASWRAASPHWSADRARMIASKYAKALAGEEDPEADDLDPLEGFKAQYLNMWQWRTKRREVGTSVVSEEAWSERSAQVPLGDPAAVAVEGWPGEGLSVAEARRCPDGGDAVIVTVTDVPDVATAALLVSVLAPARPAVVGASLAEDPAWRGVRHTTRTGAVQAAVADLAALLRDGVLHHDGGDHLGAQVLALRTSPSAGGLTIRSHGRADAVKAAVWAAQEARKRSSGRMRILTP